MQPRFNQIHTIFFSTIFLMIGIFSMTGCGYSDKEEKQINDEAVEQNDTSFDAMMSELGEDTLSRDTLSAK